MATVFDVPADKLIEKAKEGLKKVEQIKPPVWSKFVKSGVSKNKPPEQEDFWFIRAASMMRQLYVRDRPLGIQRFRNKYGTTVKTLRRPTHFKKASGSTIRKILQQLEAAGFAKKVTINGKKGRTLTPKGKSYLDKFAAQVAKESKNG
jgi:small subunit ribosomal protein S19e